MNNENLSLNYKIKNSCLRGEVSVSGAKNSALRLQAASLLTSDNVTLENYPQELLDARLQEDMLRSLGKSCSAEGDVLVIAEDNSISTDLNWERRSIRNTLLILGCLTARFGEAKVPLPGGCKLGERKFDLHIDLLESMGAKVYEDGEYLRSTTHGKRLRGCNIHLPIRSTGATENAILCGTLAEGKTIIWNPHIRPEILDLISMLRKMGAEIDVRGQESITIIGQTSLNGTSHYTIPDNIEALTWLIGSVITNGDIEIKNFPSEHLLVPLEFLRESGARFYSSENDLIVRGGECFPVELSTGPYPGINSDMQPLFASYGVRAKGKSKITDLRFLNRYGYASEMSKLGAKMNIANNYLEIEGGTNLRGCTVRALDLRTGIALALLGFCSEGEVLLEDAWQIERGYNRFVQKCKALGGQIEVI